MQTKSRKLKEDFWFWVIFIALVLFALISDWWQTNAVLGWIISILILAALAFIFIRFKSVRSKAFSAVKSTTEKVIFDEEVSSREPLPNGVRKEIMTRSNYRCENHDCKFKGIPHIHHIDMKNSNNHLSNLIALCPNCHRDAHRGNITASQCRNWVKRDYYQMKINR
ncbi:MAG: HNH endonuclease [Dehalococcoides mccartyi]|uniref:HNH endonuclease n=1 Tax=Dehalococcoides mccartyi TaxID=61435 RepID=UPI00242B0934|nr:HNH endonuclease [Dehalococcoides mccartyi]MCF7635545.1 HNH endonuclease [Dehalococcoides mccartyi]